MKIHRSYLSFLSAVAVVGMIGCGQEAPKTSAPASTPAVPGKPVAASTAQAVASDKCKDFPVPIYTSRTSLFCETGAGPPLRQTAYIESANSVEKVAAFYKTQVQSAGWTVDPMEVESSTRALVSMKKGKGYANVVINPGAGGSGSRIQIHAYPNGNE